MKYESVPVNTTGPILPASQPGSSHASESLNNPPRMVGPLRSLHLPSDGSLHPTCFGEGDGHGATPVTLSQLQPHYATIGECLAVAEASSLWVGIPYLLTTQRVQDLRRKRHSSLSEFVRSSLVTVPTWALCSYVDDLLLMDSRGPAPELQVPAPSAVERYGLSATALTVGTLCCLILVLLGETSWLALVQSVSLWSLLGVTTWFLAHDKFRHWTFVRLLCAEITRRGGGQSGTSAMPLTPA